MAEFVIRTPVPDYTGSVGSLNFAGGQALANDDDHASEIAYCRSRGYEVEEVVEEKTTRGRRAASTEEKSK